MSRGQEDLECDVTFDQFLSQKAKAPKAEDSMSMTHVSIIDADGITKQSGTKTAAKAKSNQNSTAVDMTRRSANNPEPARCT